MVKNKKLSKSSIAIIVLAVLLIASLVMGMTGAWFTSRPEQKTTGELKFGSVTIAVNATGWTFDLDKTHVDNNEMTHPYLTNTKLMPGDTINGNFDLTNNGDPAYVFMIYGGTVVREFAAAKRVLAEEDAEDAWVAAAHDNTAWADATDEAKNAAIASALSTLETNYASGTDEQKAAINGRLKANLFEVLANIADADHNTAGNQPAVTVPSGATTLTDVTVDEAQVYYYTLERADAGAEAHADEKEVRFTIILDGEVFGDDYEGATIEVHVEFVAVQVANLTPEAAADVAFGDRIDNV